MSLVKEQLGEPAIRDMYDRVLLPLFVWRYEKFDIDKHPWDEALEVLMLVACEAMRGHLVGPERTGDIELVEYRGPLRSCASTPAAPASGRSAATGSRARRRAWSRRTAGR